MQETEILEKLRSYIEDEILEGEDLGLEPDTPLLEIGVINSIELMKLIGHIEKEFGVLVPPDQILAENFKDLKAITALLLRARTTS